MWANLKPARRIIAANHSLRMQPNGLPNGSRHRAGDLPAADAPGLKCPVLQNLGFMIWPSREPEVFRMRILQRQLQNRLD
jgi:hypothetical protein